MGKRERDSENILTRFPKTTTTTTIYFDQKKQVTKVNYLVVYIMIANLDMVYLEKPYGLIKARIPNIKLNLQRTGKYDTYCAVLIL